jgi:SAM-dependent methyltransferase
MRWLAKAALLKALDAVPGGDDGHYLLQRRVTRSLPPPDEVLVRKARRAPRHLERFERHGGGRSPADAVVYEFGAGWDLTGPLVLWALGVEHQILVDVRRNARGGLVAHTVDRLDERHDAFERALGRPLRRPGGPLRSLAELEPRFGIRYLAPVDARATGLPAASVDLVTSTNTLEHVLVDDLPPLLRECRRLLRPDGVMSVRIDMRDHFADSDPAVSPYNFLRFSETRWQLLNSRLLHQNRLRRSDYLALFAAAGLDVVEENTTGPTAAGLAALERLPLAEPFRGRPLADLAVRRVAWAARPRGDSPDALEELEGVGRRGGTGIGFRAAAHRGGLGGDR